MDFTLEHSNSFPTIRFWIQVDCKREGNPYLDLNYLVLCLLAILTVWVTVKKVPSFDMIEDMPANEQAWREVGWRQAVLYTTYSSIMLFILYYYRGFYFYLVVDTAMGLVTLFLQSVLFE